MLPQWENSQQDFSARTRATVFPGSAAFGIKDPVLVRGGDLRVLATLHPLTEGDENAATAPTLTAAGADMHTRRDDV
jgi:hypothetical protein